jgi:hypothetical protein
LLCIRRQNVNAMWLGPLFWAQQAGDLLSTTMGHKPSFGHRVTGTCLVAQKGQGLPDGRGIDFDQLILRQTLRPDGPFLPHRLWAAKLPVLTGLEGRPMINFIKGYGDLLRQFKAICNKFQSCENLRCRRRAQKNTPTNCFAGVDFFSAVAGAARRCATADAVCRTVGRGAGPMAGPILRYKIQMSRCRSTCGTTCRLP